MVDRGTLNRAADKEVQHSKTQAEALSLRGIAQRALHRSADHLSAAQIVLFARMRDEGAKICVTGALDEPPADPATLNAFLSARLARGRQITRLPNFLKMPFVARTTALRSIMGGHVEWVGSHPDKTHHFYGLSEHGKNSLARHQIVKRQPLLPPE